MLLFGLHEAELAESDLEDFRVCVETMNAELSKLKVCLYCQMEIL